MKRLKQAIDQSLKALHQLEVAANEHGKQRSEDWDGQGKPPAGAACEYAKEGDLWEVCMVLSRDGDAVWLKTLGGHYHTASDTKNFRPIQPEEDKVVKDMLPRVERTIKEITDQPAASSQIETAIRLMVRAGYKK